MRTLEYKLVTSGDMSADIESASKDVDQVMMASVQASWSGSPVGSIKLQISNDNVKWSDYSQTIQSVSGAGDFMWNIPATPFGFVRVVYTRTSGTGTLDVTIYEKGV